MSLDAAKAFIKRMETDSTFKAKILAVGDTKERLKLINAEGFDCTADEIGSLATELSEEQLRKITGGTGFQGINLTIN